MTQQLEDVRKVLLEKEGLFGYSLESLETWVHAAFAIVSSLCGSNVEIAVRLDWAAKRMTHLVLARWASAWLCGKLARPEPLRLFLWRAWPWLLSFDPSPRLLYSVNGPLGSKPAKPAQISCDLELQTKVSITLLACRNMTSLKLYPGVDWMRS